MRDTTRQPACDLRIADLHNRFAAFITDWHIRTVPLALWGFWVFFKWFPGYWRAANSGAASLERAWELLLPVLHAPGIALGGWLSFAAYLLYHPFVELAMHGDSPGKRVMRITVVSVNGGAPSPRQILIRNAWRALEFLPFAWLWGMVAMWRSDENARTGDIKAGTRVVRDQ